MRLKVGYGYVSVDVSYGNKMQITISQADGQFDERSASVEFEPGEWVKLKRAGDLIMTQVQVQKEFEADMNNFGENWTGQK